MGTVGKTVYTSQNGITLLKNPALQEFIPSTLLLYLYLHYGNWVRNTASSTVGIFEIVGFIKFKVDKLL